MAPTRKFEGFGGDLRARERQVWRWWVWMLEVGMVMVAVNCFYCLGRRE